MTENDAVRVALLVEAMAYTLKKIGIDYCPHFTWKSNRNRAIPGETTGRSVKPILRHESITLEFFEIDDEFPNYVVIESVDEEPMHYGMRKVGDTWEVSSKMRCPKMSNFFLGSACSRERRRG